MKIQKLIKYKKINEIKIIYNYIRYYIRFKMPKKSKKSSWKKIQIENLNEHFEEINRNDAIENLPDEELFTIDTTGSANLEKKVNKVKRKAIQPQYEREKVEKIAKRVFN